MRGTRPGEALIFSHKQLAKEINTMRPTYQPTTHPYAEISIQRPIYQDNVTDLSACQPGARSCVGYGTPPCPCRHAGLPCSTAGVHTYTRPCDRQRRGSAVGWGYLSCPELGHQTREAATKHPRATAHVVPQPRARLSLCCRGITCESITSAHAMLRGTERVSESKAYTQAIDSVCMGSAKNLL